MEANEKIEELAQVSGSSSDENDNSEAFTRKFTGEREEIERILALKIEQPGNLLAKDNIVRIIKRQNKRGLAERSFTSRYKPFKLIWMPGCISTVMNGRHRGYRDLYRNLGRRPIETIELGKNEREMIKAKAA